MTGGTRMPTWKERENNRRRERRRRAIAAKIFAGLRMYGNYELPKHCDNNEVLKALCGEAGWTVDPDGTTYRKGCRPSENVDIIGGSLSASPRSSYNPSPASSSFPSPASSTYPSSILFDGNSLIPWLRNLSSSSSSSSATPSKFIHSGSISAPVTPPLSSPMARTPYGGQFDQPIWAGPKHSFLPLSMPPSPSRPAQWLAGAEIPQNGPGSPMFNLISAKPFGFMVEHLSRAGPGMACTPGQSGTCSPAVRGDGGLDIRTSEFAFGCDVAGGFVKPWEGERIHEELGSDDLELTLGSSKMR